MALIGTFSLKQQDGTYKQYTVAFNNECDKFGRNIQIYETQSLEDRKAKKPKVFLASGKKIWDDGIIPANAPKKNDNQKTDTPKVEVPIPKQFQLPVPIAETTGGLPSDDDEVPF